MTNELAKRNETYAARYTTDPYAQFASEGGPGIQGKLLQCKKGDWGLGQDGAAVLDQARFLVVIHTMLRGWLRWQGGIITDAKMGPCRRGLRRPALCERCHAKGEITLAREVHHRVKCHNDTVLQVVWDNLESLCQPCHAPLSADDRRGFSREIDVDGYAADSKHPMH